MGIHNKLTGSALIKLVVTRIRMDVAQKVKIDKPANYQRARLCVFGTMPTFHQCDGWTEGLTD